MTRIKRGVGALKRRRKTLSYTKGFRHGAKSKERIARERLLHAWSHAFVDRRKKKGDFRRLWNVRINAASREHGLSYSRFMQGLKKAGIGLDRKILSEIAMNEPDAFRAIIKAVKS